MCVSCIKCICAVSKVIEVNERVLPSERIGKNKKIQESPTKYTIYGLSVDLPVDLPVDSPLDLPVIYLLKSP